MNVAHLEVDAVLFVGVGGEVEQPFEDCQLFFPRFGKLVESLESVQVGQVVRVYLEGGDMAGYGGF